jgi:hypothetical protein
VGQPADCAIAQEVVVEIGAMPVLVRTDSPEFLQILGNGYSGFVNPARDPEAGLEPHGRRNRLPHLPRFRVRFDSVCELVRRLTSVRDGRVWELIV